MNKENSKTNFKLIKFSLEFERGYSWEKDSEKQKDRYEGYVKFSNDINEEFILKVYDDISLQIIKFIANKLAENTESLVKNMTNCIIVDSSKQYYNNKTVGDKQKEIYITLYERELKKNKQQTL